MPARVPYIEHAVIMGS